MGNMERNQKALETVLDLVASNSNSVLFCYDLDTRTVQVDMRTVDNIPELPRVEEMREMPGSYAASAVFPDCQEDFCRTYERIHEGEEQASCLAAIRDVNGEKYWVRISLKRVAREGDGPNLAVGQVESLQRFTQGNPFLQEEWQKEYFRALNLMGDAFYAICVLNQTTNKFYVLKLSEEDRYSLRSIRDIGHNYERQVDRLLQEGVHPAHKEKVRKFMKLDFIKRAFKHTDALELEFLRKTGDHYEWVLLRLRQGNEDSGMPRHIVYTFENIEGERRRAREQQFSSSRFGYHITESYERVYEVDYELDEVFLITYDMDGLHRTEMSKSYLDFFLMVRDEIIFPEDRDRFTKFLHPDFVGDNLSEESGKNYIEIRRMSQGRYQWYAYMLQEQKWEDKTTYMVYLKNVDSVRQEEEREKELLADALHSAEDANRAKSDFLARMSHDIRTPMNAIMGMTLIAQENMNDPKKVQECLQKIDVSSRHLLNLINDVLDMSRIESGKMVLAKDRIQMEELIEEVRIIVGPQADQRHQNLRISLISLSHRRIIGDSLRLQQILVNVIGNAVKFTPEGGRITVEVREQKQKYARYASYDFIIRDTGRGMDKAMTDTMFDPFVRGKSQDGSKPEGTGLGLAITKNLVNMMNGTIRVDSNPGAGTTFVISLDFAIPGVEAGEIPERNIGRDTGTKNWEDMEGKLAGKRFMVAEDNDINREIATTLLKQTGAQVEEAQNGATAVTLYKNHPEYYYDIIFMDIQMPVLDGFAATGEIRRSGRKDAGSIPIIAMTANAFRSDMEAARDAGMTAHLAKPLDMESLTRLLEVYAGKQEVEE